MAFTSFNTASLLYEQTGAQQADRQQAPPPKLPRGSRQISTHTYTHREITVYTQTHIFIHIPRSSLNIQVNVCTKAQRKRHLSQIFLTNDCAHHKSADTQTNVPLAGRQHPVLWRNRKCVCVFITSSLREAGLQWSVLAFDLLPAASVAICTISTGKSCSVRFL